MSLTNKIVANIKKSDININEFINTNNVVCIDTSYNRIGINTKNPRYSIDILGDNSINVDNLIINNYANINEISSNKIFSYNLSGILLDMSYTNINEISSNIINSEFIKVNDLSITTINTELLTSSDICVNFLDIKDGSALIQYLSINTIDVSNINIPFQSINNIDISEQALIKDISSVNIYSNEISANFLHINNNAIFYNESSFNNIDVSKLLFNNISGNIGIFDNIICNISGVFNNDINVNKLITNDIVNSNGDSIIKDGEFSIGTNIQNTNIPTLTVSSNLIANNLDISNLYISNNLNLSNLNNAFILPNYEKIKANELSGNFSLDYSNNIIKIFTNNWNNLHIQNNYAMYDLSNCGGNEISFNIFNNIENYFIKEPQKLLLNNNSDLYKYVPIKLKNSINSESLYNLLGNNFIEDPSYKYIGVNDLSGIYELNANISLQFLNRIPGDVEANNYSFGIYSDKLFDNYVKTYNNILVFDNSYNFSNSSLNYIGPLKSDTSGFSFYITSNKDLSYISVKEFNASIKLLNY